MDKRWGFFFFFRFSSLGPVRLPANKMTLEAEARGESGPARKPCASLSVLRAAALRPLPSANLWGVCADTAPLWGAYIRPVPHFKERP